MASESDLALTHNDLSVLENHHCSRTFFILKNPKTALFSGLSREMRKHLRSVMIAAFLATDMSGHFEKVGYLSKEPAFPAPTPIDPANPFNAVNDKNRLLMTQLVIHTADLSGQTLNWPLASEWEGRIVQEFIAQVQEEESLGLKSEPFMKNLEDAAHRATLQVNFIQFVLEPWYVNMARLMPGMQPFYTQLKCNKEKFENVAAQAKERQQKQAEDTIQANGH
jgi:hypothetical protein